MEHFLWLQNQRSAQSKFVPEYFSKILDGFSTVIELGTFTGVFTKWLSQNVPTNCKIFSYDINPSYREVGDLDRVNFRIADVFDPATIFEIKSLIQFGGRTLILCDGGDKETEFKLYSRFLKHNDVIMLHDYEETSEEYAEISRQIGWTTVSESHLESISRYLKDLQLENFWYKDFKKVLWGSFIKKSRRRITLTITTSRRFNLFERTIKSFRERCLDFSCINKIFHFDDSSSEEERNQMKQRMESLFPGCEIETKYFERYDLGIRRHCEIINFLMMSLKRQSDFNFHLEDDWFFEKDFSLTECIDFLKKNSDVAFVGVSQPLRNFPNDIKPVIIDGFWKWYYDDTREILSNLFIDSKMMELRNQEGYWCYYINWPYFGFRPGVWDVEKISHSEKINCESKSSFELQFAIDLSKKYVSFNKLEAICTHIGEDVSSYDLNQSER